MIRSLNDIEWADPILPSKVNRNWEAIVKKQMGVVPDVLTRVSSSPWLRVMMMKALRMMPKELPRRLIDIATLVCAQENACRFCYGIARTQMRLFGYSDEMISGVEQDMLMAELDQKDRVFIRFCRGLARSNPRPPKKERDKLVELGFSQRQVTEMAFHIARECFVNRVVTFISSPPMYDFERLSNSIWGRLLRPLIVRKLRAGSYVASKPMVVEKGPFFYVMQALSEIPAAAVFQDGIKGAFESTVLSMELKVLTFAVVARSLSCEFCSSASHNMALELGFTEDEFNDALSTLTCNKLSDQEQKLLAWVRDTVHYQTGPIQKRLKELSNEVDDDKLLEAIGVASLANSIVRLAVLLE